MPDSPFKQKGRDFLRKSRLYMEIDAFSCVTWGQDQSYRSYFDPNPTLWVYKPFTPEAKDALNHIKLPASGYIRLPLQVFDGTTTYDRIDGRPRKRE